MAPLEQIPLVSVVVPTRDRPDELRACLDALRRQHVPGRTIELLVVDDAPDAAGDVATLARAAGARVLHSGGAGPAAARNLGARAARGSVLCFTDDDCRPDRDWVARLVGRIEGGADAVGGSTRIGNGRDRLAAAAQIAANGLTNLPRAPFAPASNIACRRDVAVDVPFDEAYGRAGAEDRDWFARLRARGYQIVLEEAASVAHYPRLTFGDFVRKQIRYGRGAFIYRRRYTAGRLERPGFYLRLIRVGFAHGVAIGLLLCVAQAATACGFVIEATTDALRPSARSEGASSPHEP